ncbi:uncharacterized protein LOC135139671 [Zophobas morio]|uniref:uncharacterized protein LOC135139671 n=1 Tax=Zophobas morio TaxID=2755281 RepID=UPI0030835D93
MYLRQAYQFDSTRRFQTLHKIREPFLYVNRYRLLKMKVSIAAKTLSASMAAALETLIDSKENIPSEAIETAFFVKDANDLFDSFNSTGINMRNNHCNPKLRCALTKKSGHFDFWNKMEKKIESWKFYDEVRGQFKTTMPFKEGWLNNIRGIRLLWQMCEKNEFKFLRTRMLNQDPLENLFSVIRQYGSGNSNPSCFQFISALKTSILNNLIAYQAYGKDCEEDVGKLLDNLRIFLSSSSKPTNFQFTENINELVNLENSSSTNRAAFKDLYDLQAITYVCGFLIKKLKAITCKDCKNCIIAQKTEEHHIFTLYKEQDQKLRLKYATKEFVTCLAEIYDTIVFFLDNFGVVPNIARNLKEHITATINFTWINCDIHIADLRTEIINLAVRLIINKKLTNLQKQFEVHNRRRINNSNRF